MASPMFGWRIKEFKGGFFDRKKVRSSMSRATRRVFSKFGAFVRQRAQESMLGHKVKNVGVKSKITNREGSSPPGKPPNPHLGLLVKFMFFAYEPEKESVIIGPAKLGGRIGNAPEALEKGGRSLLMLRFAGGGSAPVSRGGKLVTINILPRPYMQPAFDAELKGLSKLWRDAMHRN